MLHDKIIHFLLRDCHRRIQKSMVFKVFEGDFRTHRYMDTWIKDYRETWIHGYIDTWIDEYVDSGIQRYRDTVIQGTGMHGHLYI